ncbi:Uncharacterised protein [Mycobacteroides abscessus subsp. abscessus]|nr:Uncharacterised protein [Mycobacteroides abscessus subsp. abscessus]
MSACLGSLIPPEMASLTFARWVSSDIPASIMAARMVPSGARFEPATTLAMTSSISALASRTRRRILTSAPGSAAPAMKAVDQRSTTVAGTSFNPTSAATFDAASGAAKSALRSAPGPAAIS